MVGALVTVSLTGVAASGAVGSVIFNKIVNVSGVAASGAVGNVSTGERFIAITGNQARGTAGTVDIFYWTTIDDSQTPSWQNVNNSQTPNWEDVEMTV